MIPKQTEAVGKETGVLKLKNSLDKNTTGVVILKVNSGGREAHILSHIGGTIHSMQRIYKAMQPIRIPDTLPGLSSSQANNR